MSVVWGVVLGAGLFLMWSSWWVEPAPRDTRRHGWNGRTQDRLIQAGAPGVTPWGLVSTSVAGGLVVWIVVAGVVGSPAIGLAFAVLAARAPFALVQYRAGRRQVQMREVWPEVVDSLSSGIRAGLSLAEALMAVGESGPEAVRPSFRAFGQDYRASGRFADCLDALKARLADPVADRIVEALKITRDVGGSDIGHLLRTLGDFLREDLSTRGEMEARQSWTVNAARLAAAAPWLVLGMLATRGANVDAYNTPTGILVLATGGVVTVLAYRLMVRLGRLPGEVRVLR